MSQFFSCDWGTSSFRLRRVNAASGKVLAQHSEASGVRALLSICPADDPVQREKVFAAFLRSQLLALTNDHPESLDGAAVIISGMASSSVGWRELPYACVPVGLDGTGLVQESLDLTITDRAVVRVGLISGLRTDSDIIRGEETEIVGLFSACQYPVVAENGIVVLPGTHSKHVRLRGRQITGFRTYMTGELFDVLSTHSLLRASVAPADGASLSQSEPRDAFVAGVRHASETGLPAALFQTRVRTVLQSVPPAANRWFLSGLLIGSETADLAAQGLDVPILLAAAEPLSTAYRLAFETLGLGRRLTVAPPEEMAVASVRGHQTLLGRCLKRERSSGSLNDHSVLN